jgi:ABC-type uncharacterized transport system permease subunit
VATLTAVEIGVYALASALYLSYLLGLRTYTAGAARVVLAIGVLIHFSDIGARCVHRLNPISSTPEAMSFISFMIAVGYLASSFRYRLAAAGAFAVPAALVLLVLARVVPVETSTPEMGPLGYTHIFLSTLGVAVFAMAAVLALLYLFQDRQLKRRELARMGRAAPLETLDRLALRCVSLGFPIFTVAIVTGAMWIARLGWMHGLTTLRPEHILAVATWVAFGILLVARVGAGWRGRRAAWLTLGGFGGAMLVVVVYFLRHAA